jgi:hypothetical protein
MRSDVALLAGAFIGSLVLTFVLAAVLKLPIAFMFLPVIPFLLRPRRSSTVKRCASCGWQIDDPRYDYCPYDGRALQVDTIYDHLMR